MYDANNSGSIDMGEFQALFQCINKWKGIFETYDQDRSGRIEEPELTKGTSLTRDLEVFELSPLVHFSQTLLLKHLL